MGRPVQSRLGEVNYNRYGMKMTIIRYRNSSDIDVEFEDGYISYNKYYKEFKNGKLVSKLTPRVTKKSLKEEKIIEQIEDLEGEIWKEIDGYDGFYEISNFGRCKTHRAKEARLLKPVKCTNGYLEYQLSKNGKRKCHLVHRLVAQAFIPNPENKKEVNHIDECITNNIVSNLEWVTPKENCNYGTRNIRVAEKISIKVVQLSLDGELIKVWNSLSEAERNLGADRSSIIRVCKGKQKTCIGYRWLYYEDYLNMVTLGEVTV